MSKKQNEEETPRMKIVYGQKARRQLFDEALGFANILDIEDCERDEKDLVGGHNGSIQHLYNLIEDMMIRACKVRSMIMDEEDAWQLMDDFRANMRKAHMADRAEAKKRAIAHKKDKAQDADQRAAS